MPWYRARDGFPKLERLAIPIGPDGQHAQHTEGTRGPSPTGIAVLDRLSGVTMRSRQATPLMRKDADHAGLADLSRSARPTRPSGDGAALTTLVAIILVAVGFRWIYDDW